MEQDKLAEEIKQFITKSVSDHWEVNKSPLLLSSLGLSIRKKFPDFESILQDGLKKYLSLWPIVQIITHPKIIQKIGAIPLGVSLPENIADLFVISQNKESFHRQSFGPSYQQDFWNSFVYDFTGRKYIVINNDNGIWGIQDNSELQDNHVSFEILETDIVRLPRETPKEEKVAEVHKRIVAWLERNSLDRSYFLNKDYVSKPHSSYSDSSRIFEAALSKLGSSDLSRIYVPLDIVKKMILDR
jgi:hypothetical protein